MSKEFSYNKSWEQIHIMLEKAEKKQNYHWMMIQRKDTPKSQRMMHMRNYKGLEGVINALRWTLGDRNLTADKVLGDKA